MGWAYCGEDSEGRPIGYSVEATCDHPDCKEDIDRGLSHVCGGMHGGSEYSCGRYFCDGHLYIVDREYGGQLCGECYDRLEKELGKPKIRLRWLRDSKGLHFVIEREVPVCKEWVTIWPRCRKPQTFRR